MDQLRASLANAASAVAGVAGTTYQIVSGANKSRVRQYLQDFLFGIFQDGENPLEPSHIHEDYRFSDGKGVEMGIEKVLKMASAKNVVHEGQLVRLMQGDSVESFFFETISTVNYGEGATDESGKDVSFTTRQFRSFGVVYLSPQDYRILRHEQRSDPIQ